MVHLRYRSHQVHGLSVLILASSALALSSRECVQAVHSFNRAGPEETECPNPVCGSLSSPQDGKTFMGRLSSECKIAMQAMRSVEVPGNVFGMDPSAKVMGTHCPKQFGTVFPTNPVVIDAPGIHPFTMCTVPKAGCTSLRRLMHTMIHYPSQQPFDAVEQQRRAHFDPYPTLWHYSNLTNVQADVYPSFIVGRNPYVRLLSGFLNKMTGDEQDKLTAAHVNKHVKRDPHFYWEQSINGFHQFVRQLKLHSLVGINEHFGLQYTSCGDSFDYEYRLKLEDQAQWFPCWEQGLNLTAYTAEGWQSLPKGDVWVGANEEYQDQRALETETSCFYKPASFDRCYDYYIATHPNWDGVSLSGLSLSDVRAVPLQDSIPLETVVSRDSHYTGSAGKWKEYYTQEIGDIVYELYKTDFKAFGYDKESFDTHSVS